MNPWTDRFRAAGIHLGLSLVVAALAAAVVFGLWYPFPYREVSGGRELFTLLVSVDVAMGPLITLMVYSRSKPFSEMRRDFVCIGVLQLAALAYGMWTVFLARPVYLAFEYERFRIVHAVDVRTELLDRAAPGFERLPLLGPQLIAVRQPRTAEESNQVSFEAAAGLSTTSRPDFWQPYETSTADILGNARPVSELMQRLPASTPQVQDFLERQGLNPAQVRYLPCNARKAFWTVFVEAGTARVLGFAAIDSF
jgi:hypothetical protein